MLAFGRKATSRSAWRTLQVTQAADASSSCVQISWDDPPGVLNPDLQELVHSCLRPNFEERPSASEVSEWITANKQRITSSVLGSADLDVSSLAPLR